MDIKLNYQNDTKNDKIKLFDEKFIENNANNIKIYHENIEYDLKPFLDLSNHKIKENIIEITVKITNKITNISFMFSKCNKLLNVEFLSIEKLDNIIDMSNIFANCSSLSSISNISDLNTSKVINMSSLFKGCNLLLSLPDISKWNTSNVNNMNYMFYGCKNLQYLPDISEWDTSKVNNMVGMFQGCSSLSYLPEISKWNISEVTNTMYMFYGCENLVSFPDISLWDTFNIINMSYMFYNCKLLKQFPDISNWNIKNLKEYKDMFTGCPLLKNIPSFARNNNQIIENPEKVKRKTKTMYIKVKKKILEYEIYENNYFLCCYKCQNIPMVYLTDKENILLSCINCGNGEDESIEKIINRSSKWLQKLIYYCNNHKTIPAAKYCEDCKKLLCELCLKIHDKSIDKKHILIEIKDLFYNFCEFHNNKLINYCKNCSYEICEKCTEAHKGHEIDNLDLVKNLNSNFIFEITEKIKKMNIYQIAQEAIETLVSKFSSDNSLKFNETKNIIMKLAQNDIKIKHNLLLLAKILFYSSHKIKNNRLKLVDSYIEAARSLKDMFDEKEIEKFKQSINKYKSEFILSSKALTDNEQNELNENIKNTFNSINYENFNSETKKNYIEKNIEFSNMLKTYIVNEAIKNPNNYLNIDETINDLDNIHNNMNSEENPEFILSILGKCIQENGTQTYISKTKDKKINDIDLSSIQSFISFGKEKKYEIHFDFGEEENNKIINNEDKRNNFLKFWKEEIARELKINQNNIILTNVNYGSVSVDATIVNEPKEKNNLLLTLKGKKNIKNVKEKPIFEVLQISPEILDTEGDRNKGWGINEKRGGEDYIPPLDGWFGIGLKVKGKYDNGDDSWLDYKNRKGEFAIAYLGINNFLNEKDIIIGDLNNISRDINEQTSSYINERIYIDEDNLRKSSKYIQCGEGICLFQNPKYAENYAGIVDLYGYRIKIMLMCRVNSEKIRQPKNCPECWILNPTSDEVRPYRILIKVFENSPLTWSSNNEIIVSVSPIKYIISAIKTDNESFYKLEKDKRFGAYLTINKQKIEKEFFAIRLYSSNYYVFINEYLRSEKILDKIKKNGKDMLGFSESEINSWVHCLYLALRNNKNVRNGTVVYRGISKYRFPSEIGIGSKFYIREFVSTSLKKKIAEQFMNYNNNKIGGTLMKITIKNNGVNGHPNYCYHIKGISCYKEEDEILISAHCYYSVTNIERTGHFDYVNITCEGFLLE